MAEKYLDPVLTLFDVRIKTLESLMDSLLKELEMGPYKKTLEEQQEESDIAFIAHLMGADHGKKIERERWDLLKAELMRIKKGCEEDLEFMPQNNEARERAGIQRVVLNVVLGLMEDLEKK